jgi:hypothetical protein
MSIGHVINPADPSARFHSNEVDFVILEDGVQVISNCACLEEEACSSLRTKSRLCSESTRSPSKLQRGISLLQIASCVVVVYVFIMRFFLLK